MDGFPSLVWEAIGKNFGAVPWLRVGVEERAHSEVWSYPEQGDFYIQNTGTLP